MWQRVLAVIVLLLCLLPSDPLQAQVLGSEKAAAPPQEAQGEESGSESQIASFGFYERSALAFALKERKLELLEAPHGRVVGRIHVVNIDVFGRAEAFLRIANLLHITTREYVIRREVLLRPGEMWDDDIVLETQRRLKDPLFTSLVVLVPVKSKDPAKVDLLVITRDIWSLRMNSTFEYQQSKLTALRLSVAENNILGLRKHGAAVFDMGQGNFTLGPQYVDKFLMGTRLQLTGRFSTIFSRKEREFEGTSSSVSLNYPLWSLRQKWAGGLSFSHYDSVVRFFQGVDLEQYDNLDTEEVESIDRSYTLRTIGFEAFGSRSFGSKVKQNVSAGYALSVRRPDFVDGFAMDPATRAAFERDVFPRSERASSVFARYNLFTPDFVMYRNLNSFSLAEDVRLGPNINLTSSAALKVLGSERNFYRGSASASYVLDIEEDGFARGAASASTRLQSGDLVDNVLSVSAKVAAPRILNSFRIVGQASMSMRLRDRANGRLSLGGNSGLRGYVISEFIGQRRLLTNLEVRSMPLKILFARVGGLVFWDMGHVADRVSDLRMKHALGLGFRSLVPQLQPVVFRLDLAFPLQASSSGFPGRISAGVAQVF